MGIGVLASQKSLNFEGAGEGGKEFLNFEGVEES